ncbi:MAG: potassium channel family protein [Nitriliruptoraceae bacterium]
MNALVLGCGRVGSGLARELTQRGVEVVVVDREKAALERLGDGFPGGKVQGSILERPVLAEAGIEHADAVAVVTGDDHINVCVALAARRQLRVPTVIARLDDPGTAVVTQRLGIRTLVTVTWGIQRIADLITATTVTPVATLGTGGVEVVEVHVPALLDGRPAAELEAAGELRVVARTHHGRTTVASGTTTLHTGDLVHVVVGAAALGRLERLVHPHASEGR